MNIVFFISDHGFGHIMRNLPVAAELGNRGHKITIVTGSKQAAAAKQYLEYTDSETNFTICNTDVGLVVESGSLEIDRNATVARVREHTSRWPKLIENSPDADVYVVDIVPWALTAAKKKGIPSFYTSNFTWIEQYESFVPKDLIELYRNAFSDADQILFHALANRPTRDFFGHGEDIGFIARPFHMDEVSKIRSIHTKPIVYLLLGLSNSGLDFDIDVSGLPYDFISTRALRLTGENVQYLDATIVNSQDYVKAADFCIAKAGWSTVSETMLAGVPVAFLEREDTPEDSMLIEMLKASGEAISVKVRELKDIGRVLERMKAHAWPKKNYRNNFRRVADIIENGCFRGRKMDYRSEYERWLDQVSDPELLQELKNMDEAEKEDAFYRNLAFGTGGLRGTIGAGTNRMNIYVVAKASQGLANYLGEGASVVIGYDSRIKSDVFARTAAGVFAANGMDVWMWPTLTPVPTVSFAVRYFKASQGVMITASHNPAQYNGYKVYGADGCQITTEAAAEILSCITKLDIFANVKCVAFEQAIEAGKIRFIKDEVLDAYLEQVKSQSVLYDDEINKEVSIVYSPLNGTGLIPVTRVLEENGFTNITVVEEQRLPDGNFPTCPYPNPEIREAMELGLQYCSRVNADLLLATDPDADRCGIAVRTPSGEYRLLTGNEVGLLLLDYICSQRIKHGRMPSDPVFIKTIVTIDLAETIAASYGVRTSNVLTGFKFIGEQIGYLEQQGKESDYICGFEESYGYLTGTYVRDKDAVNAAYMICEMYAYYHTRAISLVEKLNELYKEYGYCLNTLHSFEFPGSAGMEKMKMIMQMFRIGVEEIAGEPVIKTEDYSQGLTGLPKADVIKYCTEHYSVVVRPSGTEPKLKIYISITAVSEAKAGAVEETIKSSIDKVVCRMLGSKVPDPIKKL